MCDVACSSVSVLWGRACSLVFSLPESHAYEVLWGEGDRKGERGEGGRGVARGGDRALKWRYTEKHSIEESAFYRREHIL